MRDDGGRYREEEEEEEMRRKKEGQQNVREEKEELVNAIVESKTRKGFDDLREEIQSEMSSAGRTALDELDALREELKTQVSLGVAAEGERMRESLLREAASADMDTSQWEKERRAKASTSATSFSRSAADTRPVRPSKALMRDMLIKYFALTKVLSPSTLQMGALLIGGDAATSVLQPSAALIGGMVVVQLVRNILVWRMYSDATGNDRMSAYWPTYRLTSETAATSSSTTNDENDINTSATAWYNGITQNWIAVGLIGAVAALLVSYSVQSGVDWAISADADAHKDVFMVSLLGNGPGSGLLMYTLLVGVLVPIEEEMIFRGFFQPAALSFVPLRASVALTALVFALFHSPWSIQPTIFSTGLVFGTVLVTSRGNLLACTLSHVAYNMSVVAMYAAGFFP